jgi:hypothetical protein
MVRLWSSALSAFPWVALGFSRWLQFNAAGHSDFTSRSHAPPVSFAHRYTKAFGFGAQLSHPLAKNVLADVHFRGSKLMAFT